MGGEAVPGTIATCALNALALGVIVTDGQARLVFANAAADRLLRQASGGLRRCSAGKVAATCHDARIHLSDLISKVCTGELRSASSYILVPAAEHDGTDLAVCVLPVAAEPSEAACCGVMYAMLLVRPIERDCNLEIEAQCLLGLSKAEARLASGLAAGLSLQEAADAQAVTLATARSHLKSIFRKTNLKRQSQLVALLRSTQIPVEATLREAATHSRSKRGDTRSRVHPVSV